MRRRSFLTAAMVGGAFATLKRGALAGADETPKRFTLRYAPHFGLFAELGGKDPVDQLKFAADQGFTAWEDNGMKGRPVQEQERIAEAMQSLGITLGVISALRGVWSKVNFAGSDAASRDEVLTAMLDIVDVAKRVNTTYLTVVPGLADPKLPQGYQFAHCVELLRRCCDVVEPHGLVMVLEPLNTQTNHPGIFLSKSSQAFALCRAVNRPSCKILFDIYHQQITDGNMLANLDLCWSEIAYLQTGDNPGRNEPGTGEINYTNVFRHIAAQGYRGIIGMEHGSSGKGAAGEQAVIEAYRALDPDPSLLAPAPQ